MNEDIQKAIKHFECVRDGAIAVLDSGFGTKPNESNIVYKNRKLYAELAIAALEKQMPKKPVWGDDDMDKIDCPYCGYGLDEVDAGEYMSKHKFCQDCGQALDWSDVK